MTGTSINLKAVLRTVKYFREDLLSRLKHIEDCVTDALGKEAYLVDDMNDYERLVNISKDKMLDGRHLSPELLQAVYRDNVTYHWHYNGETFRVQPIREGTEKGMYCIASPGISTFITFHSLSDDLTDYGCHSIWEALEARVTGFADGYLSATRKELSKDDTLKEYIKEKVDGIKGACGDPDPAGTYYGG